MNLGERLGKIGLIPVVVFDKVEYALPTAKAMIEGGLPVMEVTLRTDAAIESMKLIKQNYPEIILGAGTVLSVEQAKFAVDAGCEFIVSPGFNDDVVQYCIDKGIHVTPGCVTPTEIEHALGFGINVLKFFPASIYGGMKACKALHGPYRMVKFVPTGGVNLDNLTEYADKNFIHAIGGGWLCSGKDMASGSFENISATIKKSIDVLLGFEIANNKNVDAQKLSNLFGIKVSVNESIEDKDEFISVITNNIDRAIYYLKKSGIKFNPDSVKENDGKKVSVDLLDSVDGCIIRLVQK